MIRDLRDYIGDYIAALDKGRKMFNRDEINNAKRAWPLQRLMAALGDKEYCSRTFIVSPFGDSEKADFCVRRKCHGWRFFYKGKMCDQADYLAFKYKLTIGQGIQLLCNLAGIE